MPEPHRIYFTSIPDHTDPAWGIFLDHILEYSITLIASLSAIILSGCPRSHFKN